MNLHIRYEKINQLKKMEHDIDLITELEYLNKDPEDSKDALEFITFEAVAANDHGIFAQFILHWANGTISLVEFPLDENGNIL